MPAIAGAAAFAGASALRPLAEAAGRAALGSCAVTTMGVYANTHGLDVTGTTVEISFAMSEKSPRRVERVELIFTMPDREYSAKDKQSLERAAGACPVHNSLHPDMEQRFVFKWAK